MTAAGVVGTVALFVDGLLAGTFVGSALIEQAMRPTAADAWLAYKQNKERVLGQVMPPFLLAAILVSGGAAILAPGRAAVATVALLGVLVVTLVVHLPINKAVMGWSPDTMPDTWSASRDRWRRWNWVRCALAIVAFAAVIPA